MISALLAFISALPSLINGVTAFSNKYFDTKVKMVAARIGADESVVRAALTAAALEANASTARLSIIAGSKVLLFLTVGFAIPYMVYEWQCIVYDKIWMDGHHKTDPLGGDLSAWATVIIACLFGSGSAVTLTHMFFNRDKTGE